MRTPKKYVAEDGTATWRVRYRLGGKETSETFRRQPDAETFAAILSNGKPDRVAEALNWLNAREKQYRTQAFAEWFELYVDQLTGVTERTRNDYRSMKRRYLSDLDPLPLNAITRSHVTSIVNRLDRAGRSPKTIKQTVHMLSTCLQLAVDEGHMDGNPCRKVRLPKQQIGGAEPRFLTHDEVRALVVATPAHYRPLVIWLVGTGMRWSEATALQARHIDLANGTARVEQAWKRDPGNGYKIGPPKTSKSKRTVNPAALALAAVAPLLRKPNDLVFTTKSGGPVMHANFYTNVWKPACKAAGLDPAPRIHDCRHTHASWLISDGQSLEAVQDQLGHESILTTRSVYGHLLPAVGVAVGRSASAAMMQALPQGLDVVRGAVEGGSTSDGAA